MAGFTLRPEERRDEYAEGIWTPYGPEPTDDERRRGIKQECYKIRMLTPKIIEKCDAEATKPVWRNHQRVEEINKDLKSQLLYDYLIEDWEGIYLDDDKTIEAECQLANKLIIANTSLDRANFIFMQGSLYANDDAARKTAQRDNFRPAHPIPLGSSEPRLPSVSAAL